MTKQEEVGEARIIIESGLLLPKTPYWKVVELADNILKYQSRQKDKPPLLKYQCKHKVMAGSSEWHMIDGYNLGAEAQRKADIQ